MDCENQTNADELKIILEKFETSVSLKNLKENQKLLAIMDDSLSVNITDYLNEMGVRENFQKQKEKLILSLADSERYTYEEHHCNGWIKLKSKPKRRIIVFRDIPKTHQKKEDIESFFKLSNQKHYDQSILKIDFSNELFFVYFEDEVVTLEVFKWIEFVKENEKNLPFSFSAFIKAESLKRDLAHTEEELEVTQERQQIILNSKEHVPRKLSANEDNKQGQTHIESLPYSKFDTYQPQYANQRGSGYVNNKFDAVNEQKTFKHQQQNEKRSKAYSIHENYYQPHSFVPLNKNYELDHARTETIEFKYSLNDIGRIFINLNFMKKFETPQFLEDEKLSDIFNEKAKNSLALFQTTKEVVELRDRAYTYYDKPRNSKTGYNNNHRKFNRSENFENY